MPFLIAAGTSLALPVPKPTIFAPGSPTTTSAEKLRFLPPLTTFVTRLIETTCSLRFRLFDSMRFAIGAAIHLPIELLKLQARFTGCIRQGFDAAVIQITATIEYYLVDSLFL